MLQLTRISKEMKTLDLGEISSTSGSPGSENSALIPALTSLGVIIFCVVALATVCVLRRKKEQRRITERRSTDQNPIYGMYYFADGRHIDEGRSEVLDNNETYGK